MREGEWGVGSGEWGVESGEWRVGSREWGVESVRETSGFANYGRRDAVSEI